MRQSIDAYLDVLRDRGRKPSTIESAENRLWLLLGLPSNADRPVRWVVDRGVELYDEVRASRATDTHHNALAVGKAWGEMCVERRWLRDNPFASVRPVGSKALGADKPQLGVDEARRLVAACLDERSTASVAVLSLLLLGVRATELVERDVRDLDDGGALLWIRTSKTRHGRRRLAVPALLQPLLLELAGDRAADQPLFRAPDGQRATRWWLSYHVPRLTLAAGCGRLSPHALRRTNATLATAAGESAHAVAGQLGHSSPAITRRAYVEPSASRDAEIGRALRVIEGGRSR